MEGTVPVLEALRAGAAVETVFVSTEHDASDEIAEAAGTTGADVLAATPAVLEAVSEASTPQGVVAVVAMGDVSPDALEEADLVLVLDQIRDPGNAGTLVRCAAAAGAGGVVFSKGCVDPYAPKTVRASAGALLRVALVRDAALDETAGRLRDAGFAIVGTDAGAETPYDTVDYTGRVAFVVGNEAWGIPGEHRALLTETVGIPMPGDAESLNAGIAGGILLFEAVRQRRSHQVGRISSAAT